MVSSGPRHCSFCCFNAAPGLVLGGPLAYRMVHIYTVVMLQIALFVFPFTVLVAWTMGQPLTMAVQPLSAVVLLISVLVAMGKQKCGSSPCHCAPASQ